MTVRQISDCIVEAMPIIWGNLDLEDYVVVIGYLKPIFDYAKKSAEAEESSNKSNDDRKGTTGGSIIEETPKAHNVKVSEAQTAEKLLSETQIYIAGFMDASNTIWNHLESCSDSIRIQHGDEPY